ncbi:mechanosensitive ion channel family protein [Acuticoccus sp. I52.16.1]|uniref:mechanosensitive ion channel family protein n=1 Tax=Acuticoccus sp. I52.16.1 TaxID=2928472 RepID=UPI001FD4AB22|nr:mechanosensitive ion channel domain-containing protein [Acuticoccus sp. I52.16.1]UOM34637.1 mechanosensitive ion channel family protein [Acuticoccus sp. I52.16.1]
MSRRIIAAVLLLTLAVAAAPAGPARAQETGDGGPTFQVDALNTGLGTPPARLDRSTPRSAMEAFVSAAQRTDYKNAAHLLDLDFVAPDEQASVGPRLAEQLSFVLDRKLPVDFENLPDRPDGMDTTGSERQPMVGVARKSLQLGVLDLPEWPVTIRLNRVQPAGEDPVWVISRQSVEHIPELFAQYGPTAFEKALPAALRQETVWGILWWELITLPLIAAFAGLAAWLTWRIMTLVAHRIPMDGMRVAICRGRLPTALLTIGVVLQITVSTIFEFSSGTGTTLSIVFWILIIAAIVYGASRTLDTIIDFASNRYLSTIDNPENTSARRWYTNLSAAKRIGVIFVVVVGLAVAFSSLRVFSSFGLSLLVSAGVATAVFGLAAQTVLGNIFASLQLALAKPIRIGDAVYYDGRWAYVEQINYTYVQLRTWDLKRFIVPVKHFVSNPFENWTMAEPKMIQPILLKLDHRTNVDEIRRVFAQMAVEDPEWSEGEDPKVQVIDHDEDAMSVRFYCIADNPTSAWDLHCRMRERLLAHLAEMAGPAPCRAPASPTSPMPEARAGPRTKAPRRPTTAAPPRAASPPPGAAAARRAPMRPRTMRPRAKAAPRRPSSRPRQRRKGAPSWVPWPFKTKRSRSPVRIQTSSSMLEIIWSAEARANERGGEPARSSIIACRQWPRRATTASRSTWGKERRDMTSSKHMFSLCSIPKSAPWLPCGASRRIGDVAVWSRPGLHGS